MWVTQKTDSQVNKFKWFHPEKHQENQHLCMCKTKVFRRGPIAHLLQHKSTQEKNWPIQAHLPFAAPWNMWGLRGSVLVGKGSWQKEQTASIDKDTISARAWGNSRMSNKFVDSFWWWDYCYCHRFELLTRPWGYRKIKKKIPVLRKIWEERHTKVNHRTAGDKYEMIVLVTVC